MSDDKRGNESPEHARAKAELYDILVREKKGPIVKEYKIPNKNEAGKEWSIDVADLSDRSNPILYEVQRGSNSSFQAKQRAFAKSTGVDFVPIYINKMPKKLKEDAVQYRLWVKRWVI